MGQTCDLTAALVSMSPCCSTCGLHRGTVFGDSRAHANHLGLEGVKGLKTFFMQCNLNLGLDMNTLLQNTTYIDEGRQVQRLEPSSLDNEDNETYQMVCLSQCYYFWLWEVIAEYSLGLTKSKFKERQQAIQKACAGKSEKTTLLPTKHYLFPKRPPQQSLVGIFPLIERIINPYQESEVHFPCFMYSGILNPFILQSGKFLFKTRMNPRNSLSVKCSGLLQVW
jgi:hypothetical protein